LEFKVVLVPQEFQVEELKAL